jgi:cytochrome c556
MLEKMGPLKAAQLSTRLSDRQSDFDAAVEKLAEDLNQLVEVVKTSKKKEVSAAVERVHTAYQNVEKIFD